MGQSLGKPAQIDAVKSAVAQLLGPTPIQPETLKGLLEMGIATAQTSQELEEIDLECSKLAKLMTAHISLGNYTALAEFIADSVDDLLKDFDPIAPSRYAIGLLKRIKHAVFYFSTWTRHALDGGCEELLISALGEYSDENKLDDCDLSSMGADVFSASQSGRTTATSPHTRCGTSLASAAPEDLATTGEARRTKLPDRASLSLFPGPFAEGDMGGMAESSVLGIVEGTSTTATSTTAATTSSLRPTATGKAGAGAGAGAGAEHHPPLVFHVVAGLMRLPQLAVVPCTRDCIVEAMRALLVLLSLDIRVPERANPFLAAAQLDRRRLSLTVTALLALSTIPAPAPPPAPDTSLVSNLVGVLSSPWSLFQAALSPPRPAPASTAPTLATDATCLLLALFYAQPKLHRNFARPYLSKISDVSEGQADLCVSYDALFQSLCTPTWSDLQLLLCYTLFYHNSEFLAYVFSRVGDVDQLLLPLLARLYEADACADFVLHTLIAILLILSQEHQYIDAWFDCTPTPTSLTWYTDRILKGACLGDVVTLVLLRTYQYTLKSTHDRFVAHTCLATLCNIAPRMVRLHAYTSQRLVAVLILLARQHAKLQAKYPRASGSATANGGVGGGVGVGVVGVGVVGGGSGGVSAVGCSSGGVSSGVSSVGQHGVSTLPPSVLAHAPEGPPPPPPSHAHAHPPHAEDVEAGQELGEQVESGIAHLLQVVATVLAARLRHNANLVYSLLVEQDAVLALQSIPRCGATVATIRSLVTLVRTKFDGIGPGASADQVLAAVAQAVRQLPDDRLARPRIAKYEYEEAPDAADYFLPCVWMAVANETRLLRVEIATDALS